MSTIEQDLQDAVEVIREAEGRSAPALPNGVHRGVPAKEYHAIRAVSSSFLKKFLIETPAHAKAMWDGRLEADDAKYCRGTALHAALMEPADFDAEYVIVPDYKRASKEWKAAEAANPGKTLLKAKDNAAVLGMRDAAWADDDVRSYLEACDERELTILWTDEATSLPCKARIDLYSSSLQMLLDVKTTGGMDRFKTTAFDLGYDIQLAFYTRAIARYFPVPRVSGILATEDACPYLPDIFEPTADFLIGGHALIERALPKVAECFALDRWPGYTKNNRTKRLDVPVRPKRVTSLERE